MALDQQALFIRHLNSTQLRQLNYSKRACSIKGETKSERVSKRHLVNINETVNLSSFEMAVNRTKEYTFGGFFKNSLASISTFSCTNYLIKAQYNIKCFNCLAHLLLMYAKYRSRGILFLTFQRENNF